MSYPTCLLALFYSDFPQATINKAINDFCKRLNARILACLLEVLAVQPMVDILSILCELGSRAWYGITSLKFEDTVMYNSTKHTFPIHIFVFVVLSPQHTRQFHPISRRNCEEFRLLFSSGGHQWTDFAAAVWPARPAIYSMSNISRAVVLVSNVSVSSWFRHSHVSVSTPNISVSASYVSFT